MKLILPMDDESNRYVAGGDPGPSSAHHAPKFHTNPWRHDASPSALRSTEQSPDGSITATYEDGHTLTLTASDNQLRRAKRPEFPGGDATARKLEGLHRQLDRVTKKSDSFL